MPRSAIDNAAVIQLVDGLLGSSSRFICGTGEAPFAGGEYFIYALELEIQSRRVCIRVPKEALKPHTGMRLMQEADLRQRIDTANISVFQPLIHFDPWTDNLLHTPYMLLGWADGDLLAWSETSPSLPDLRHRILRAVADASLDLLQIRQSGSLLFIPLPTAADLLRQEGAGLDHVKD